MGFQKSQVLKVSLPGANVGTVIQVHGDKSLVIRDGHTIHVVIGFVKVAEVVILERLVEAMLVRHDCPDSAALDPVGRHGVGQEHHHGGFSHLGDWLWWCAGRSSVHELLDHGSLEGVDIP